MNMQRNAIPKLKEGTVYGGRYRIVSPIGRGGMGRVYLAEDIRLIGRKRALKITASLQDQRDQFIREAEWLAQLQHPHLPDIVDYFPPDENGWAVIVMEYISGDTLEGIFAKSGYRLPYPRIARYAGQLCGLLCYLHGLQPPVVFRDLKPSNVIIDQHDRAILVDFGIARAFRPDAAMDTVKLGTPAFAAPEQFKGLQTDQRSDLYSLGALLYYLLSGGRHAAGRRGSMRKMLQDDVPASFAELLEQLLSENPSDRPQSAAELLQLLQCIPQPQSSVIHVDFSRADRQSGVTVAAILSAYPGAGATLAALGMSNFLNQSGIHHALVEMPGGDAELYGLLDGPRHMPRSAVFADPSGSGETTPCWKDRAAHYFPVPPDSSIPPEDGFFAWLRRLGVPIVLLDVSSRWDSPGMMTQLAESGIDSFWWVADCLPSKWSRRRQAAAEMLARTAARRHAEVGWIANKDHAFPGRSHWLAGFPSVPAARLPLLPVEAVVQAAWKGTGFPAESVPPAAFERAFGPWARRIISKQES